MNTVESVSFHMIHQNSFSTEISVPGNPTNHLPPPLLGNPENPSSLRLPSTRASALKGIGGCGKSAHLTDSFQQEHIQRYAENRTNLVA